MPNIELDQATFETIDLAARVTGMTHAQVVARLVSQSKAGPSAGSTPTDAEQPMIGIFVDYEGHRTTAQFHQVTHRVEILEGPLAERSFKSPSSAARAVIGHYKPDVSPQRNGWSFWLLNDGSGRFLQSVRGE